MPKKVGRLSYNSVFNGSLIGISSFLPNYMLCFYLNKSLKIDLRKKEDFKYYSRKFKKDLSYVQYYYEDETRKLTFSVLSNNNPIEKLLKKFKQFDYFIIISGTSSEVFSQSIIENIKQTPEVIFFTILDTENEKEIAYIQQFIELSIIEIKKN